ncbi:protein sidekick-1-like [Brevipalpus obovatus]|uniref:protein sidekick-1-like n=1 Tax=Brevipalpus obovatus TaxID=246614 RepID=UPI003D9E4D51
MMKVSVIEPPTVPNNFMVHQTWSRRARVSWDRPVTSKTPIINYIVQYWRVSSAGKNERPLSVNVSSTMSYLMLKDLQPSSVYEATITAMNEVGESLPAKSIRIETGEEEPTSPPSDVTVAAVSPSTIRVAWRAPPESTWTEKVTKYVISAKQSHDYNAPVSYFTVDAASSNISYEYFLGHLVKDTQYVVSVLAANIAGTGPASSEIREKTLTGDVPEAPILHVLSTGLNEAALRYMLMRSKSPIQHLTIHVKEAESRVWKESSIIPNNENSGDYVLPRLHPSSFYMVYMTASNEYGDSDPSRIIRIRTTGSMRDTSFAKSYRISDMSHYPIVPVTIAFAVVTIVIVLAFVYVRKVQIDANKPNVEFCSAKMPPGFAPNVDTLRYITHDSEKPLMQGNFSRVDDYQFPMAYDTKTFREMTMGKMGHPSTDPRHTYSTPR